MYSTTTQTQSFIHGVKASIDDGVLILKEIERSVIESIPYWRSGYRRVRYAVAMAIVIWEFIALQIHRDVARCTTAPSLAILAPCIDVQVETVKRVDEAPTSPSIPLLTAAPLATTPKLMTMTTLESMKSKDTELVRLAKSKRYPGASKWSYSKVLSATLRQEILAYVA